MEVSQIRTQVVTKIAGWEEGFGTDGQAEKGSRNMTQTASGRVNPSPPQGETFRKPSSFRENIPKAYTSF